MKLCLLVVSATLIFLTQSLFGQKSTSEFRAKKVSPDEHYDFRLHHKVGKIEIGSIATRPSYQWFARYTEAGRIKLEDLTCYYGKRLRQVRTGKDTFLLINTYRPDPLSVNDVVYGGPFQDFGDSATGYLNSALHADSVPVRYDTSRFMLKNAFARHSDFSSPTSGVVTPQTRYARVNRNHQHFESYNALYHITRVAQTLIGIGLAFAVDSAIAYDDNALNGADESAFFPANHGLAFGRGGVDDAEDADIIVHEYFHAVHHKIAPFTNLGAERRATEEGTCDYFAQQFSLSLTANQPNLIFNWDGHNEFWDGRRTDVTSQYPGYLNGNIYHDGQLWASALVQVANAIGPHTLDSLLLVSIRGYLPNQTMRRAAQLLLKTDSILFNGAHTPSIQNVLIDYGLADLVIVGGKESKSKTSISFIPSQGSISINAVSLYHVTVASVTGQVLASRHGTGVCTIGVGQYCGPIILSVTGKDNKIIYSKILSLKQ